MTVPPTSVPLHQQVLDAEQAAWFIALLRSAGPELARRWERLSSDEAVKVAAAVLMDVSDDVFRRMPDQTRFYWCSQARPILAALLAWAETPDSEEEL